MKATEYILSDISEILSGFAWPSNKFNFQNNGIPIIRIQNIDSINSDFAYFDDEYNDKFLIKEGDILLSLSGSFKLAIWSGPKALLNQRIVKITPQKEVDEKYFFYALQSKLSQIANLGRHALVSNVAVSDLRNIKIFLPNVQEQRRIAAILDKAEALRAKRREAIAELDQLLQSVFLEMFGGKDFPEMTVEELALARKGSIRTGPFGSQLLHSEFTDHGIKVLGIDNAVKNTFPQGEGRYISLEKYESLKRYTVYPGDVIITIMGTCGRCAVVPENIEKSINTKHLCCITLDNKKCKSEYLHSYFLMHPSARKYLQDRSKGAIMDGLNMGIIKEMPISCPPIDLQEKYCSFKSKIQKQREKLISFEIELENLNKSLQQQYFQ